MVCFSQLIYTILLALTILRPLNLCVQSAGLAPARAMLAHKGSTSARSSSAILGKQALRLRGGGAGIQSIVAREVLDSRGNPTVEVIIQLVRSVV